MSGSAHDRLQPSRLSDQLEALGSDVDLTELTLALRSRASLSIIEMVTDGQISRTIEGASTLSLTLHDRDQKIRRSALLAAKTSVKIDGLWFRLVSVETQDNDIRLQFEDREVNVLRAWPPTEKPELWPRLASVDKTTRAQFAKRLIDDVKGELEIRFVCPALDTPVPIHTSRDRPPPATKRQRKDPGLPPGANITVKNGAATPTQRSNLERILDVGYSMGASERELTWAVMTVTQESRAENIVHPAGTCTGGGSARGMFGHCAGGDRPDGGGGWPVNMDIEEDAHSFFEVAAWLLDQMEKGEKPPLSDGAACSEIQRDYTWNTSKQGVDYGQWASEASRTVRIYLGTQIEPVPPPGAGDQPATRPPLILDDGSDDTARMFYRGKRTTVNGRKRWSREDNWTCLGRLADEIRWRRFCVSGSVYFISEPDLFHAAAAMTLVPYSPGVDAIDGRYDVGQHNAAVTVKCRADRWEAPPGTVIELKETGLFDGRWIVATISRSLFNAAATITLKKPRPALPELKAPEYGSGQTSGTIKPKRKGKPLPPPPPVDTPGYRDPFRDVGTLVQARIDQGVDYASPSADPIYAIGNGKINYFSRSSGWPGGVFIGYTLTDGPARGLSVFVSEYVTPAEEWEVGDLVNSDTVLCRFVAGVTFAGNGIETGWSVPGSSSAMAHDVYRSGHATAFGANFSEFLTSLNARNAGRYDYPDDRGHESGSLPSDWPRWRPA